MNVNDLNKLAENLELSYWIRRCEIQQKQLEIFAALRQLGDNASEEQLDYYLQLGDSLNVKMQALQEEFNIPIIIARQ